jgi:hypothetical protein
MAMHRRTHGFGRGVLAGLVLVLMMVLAALWLFPPLLAPEIEADAMAPPGAPAEPAPGGAAGPAPLVAPAPGRLVDGLPAPGIPGGTVAPAPPEGPGSPSLVPSGDD